MPLATPDLDFDLGDLPVAEWYARLEEIGEEHGHFHRLGSDHATLLIDAGKSLLVTFETVEAARRGPTPRGFDFAARLGWSVMCLLSEGDTWFRDPAVYGTFDRLSDDGFFEDFDQVLFLGSGSCGYAAAAYSVAAPGARVLALRPQATLDPAMTGWDRRFLRDRRRDFTSRYGYAPEMVDAADHAWIVHDPVYAPDAMHAALFRRPNVTALRAPHTGARIEPLFDLMEIFAPLTEAAMCGRLDRSEFARLWRARRDTAPWLRAFYKRVESSGRTALADRIRRYGLASRDGAWFRDRLEDTGRRATPAAAE
ncbi:MAG: hypothetical protein JJT81_17590 [Rubellimicrobium sp.]|nr:hypothetical protein [Rubellimicrobium sp.]